jgi:hypothetical protein
MDPAYVSVAEFVKTLQAGENFQAERITPLALADALERDNRAALTLVRKLPADAATLRFEVADIRAWSHLGLHLAQKLRGAVALQTYRATGNAAFKNKAVESLKLALGEWDELIRVTRPMYRDMKLAHYNGNAFTANPHNLFHWALIRDEVARDIEVAAAE